MKKDLPKTEIKVNKKSISSNMYTTTSTVRSSAAEYLTFISATGEASDGVELRYEDENIWMTQKMMAELYGVSVQAIDQHLNKLTKDSEIVKEYTIKGFAMDDERLKNSGTILNKKFFEDLLTRIREIRLSERKFYQKITDIYATAIDYDNTAESTKKFFANVQNKLHFAIHGETAAEVIVARANSKKENMGLLNWRDAPLGKVQKFDVVVAKNYLTEEELFSLQRIVSAYLDLAEIMAVRNIPMTMQDWATRLDRFLQLEKITKAKE